MFLSFERVTVEKTKVRDLSFNLREQENLLIRGPSGVGKSSILKAILGFVPFKGRIKIGGEPLTPRSAGSMRRLFSYVPQDWNVFWGRLKDNLREIFNSKINKKARFKMEDFLNLLKILGFEDANSKTLEKNWDEFSGGERQRILIAIALLLKRPAILLDEPTSALDEKLKRCVVDTLNGSYSGSIIVVSHDRVWEDLKNLRVLSFSGEGWELR